MSELQTMKRTEFDVWNEVPLVPQLTGMSCWAAAAAMIIGWRDVIGVEAEQVAKGAGRWAEYRDGLHPLELEDFARAWKLTIEHKLDWTVEEMRALLEQYGPVWIGEASPGLHSIVIAGMHGDGTADGTSVRINDPWPLGRGERYTISWRQLMENFHNATSIAGVHAQVLHAGGRRGGRSESYRYQEKRETRTARKPSKAADPYAVLQRRAPQEAYTVQERASVILSTLLQTRQTQQETCASDPTDRLLRNRAGNRMKGNIMSKTVQRPRHSDEYPTVFGSSVAYASGAIAAGDLYIDTKNTATDPLAGHDGTGANLCLIWNSLPDDVTSVDVVVHLHGYSSKPPDEATLRAKVAAAGLDLAGRARPTLALVPRGRKVTKSEHESELKAWETNGKKGSKPNPERYSFPALTAGQGAGLEKVVALALEQLRSSVLPGVTDPISVDRLIITAHSGGGAPLNRLLAWRDTRRVCNPHEVHVFDALYGETDNLVAWVKQRIALDRALPASELSTQGGALRIAYRANEGTGAHSVAVGKELPGPDDILHVCYRSEPTSVLHVDIPRTFGPTLLANAANDLTSPGSALGLSANAFDFDAERVDDDVRAYLDATPADREPLAENVLWWISELDRSAIELLSSEEDRKHYLEDVDWAKQSFKGRGKNTTESEALFKAITQAVPERRVPFTLKYHNVDKVVQTVPDSGGRKLFPAARDSFVTMRDAAKAENITLALGSAWRSEERQEEIRKGNTNAAAVAQTTSAHTYGLAVDIKLSVPGLAIDEASTHSMPNMVAMYRSPVYKWLALHAREHGWFPYRREPWHWEYNPPELKERFEAVTGRAYGAPIGLMEHYQSKPPDVWIPRSRASSWESGVALEDAPIDWCAMRLAIAAAARAEEQHWTSNNLVESDAAALQKLEDYWGAVPGINKKDAAKRSAADEDDWAWSAAFICYVMKTAGVRAQDGFGFGQRHLKFIVEALRNRERSDMDKPFWLTDHIEVVHEALPEPGDLICFNRRCGKNQRMTTHTYTSLRNAYWDEGRKANVEPQDCSHTAIVVGIGNDAAGSFVETIGGNESDSVRLNNGARISLNADGGIDNPQNLNIFGMIKIVGCNP